MCPYYYLVAYMSYVASISTMGWLYALASTFRDHALLHDYAVTHVFLPSVNLLEKNGYSTLQQDHLLARAVCAAPHAY